MSIIIGACYLVKSYTTVKIVEIFTFKDGVKGVYLKYEGYPDTVYWHKPELLNRIEKKVNCFRR